MKEYWQSKTRVRACLTLVATALATGIAAQQSWTKKPYTQWSKSDAETVLNDSPWAARQEIRIKFDKETQVAAGAYTPMAGVTDTSAANAKTEVSSAVPVDFIFTVRLRSALPVREAMVRLKQFEANTDKMNEKQRAAFEAQVKGLLECPACAQNYVVTLSSKSTNRPGADAVYATLKGGRLADLQRYVYIANERGQRRTLVHFVPPKAPGEEAVFFFPRDETDRIPLLTPENKELLINLSDNQPNSITNFKLDVSKLVVNGKVEF